MKSDPKLIEDWKWGPNYYLEGMVFGFRATQRHVNLVFFKGTQLKDKKKLLQGDPRNLNIRSLRFTDINQVDEIILLEYIIEAIDNNKKGLKLKRVTDKTIEVPPDVKKQFKKAGILGYFESRSYSHKKEHISYIEQAKKAETRTRRIEKAVQMLQKNALEFNIKNK